MQARFYLPMYGRFASPDPARDQHFEETQSWNIYSYCQNNPVMKTDPTGMLIEELKNWCTGGGWNKNAEAEKVRMVRQVEWSSDEGRKLGIRPGYSVGLNKAGQVVRSWNSEAIKDDSGSLLVLAGGAQLLKAGGEALVEGVGTKAATETIGATGKVGEDALKALGGESQVYLPTSQGARFVDQLVNGIANESKVGATSLTKDVAKQIAKDVELIKTGQIQGANWHFFRSPVTGLGGPTAPLRQALENAGIQVTLH